MDRVWSHYTHLDRPQFWIHDCDQCRVLGQVREYSLTGKELKIYDLFLCCDSDEEDVYTVRFTNEPSDCITRGRMVWKIAAENGDELSKQVTLLINIVNLVGTPLAVVSQSRGENMDEWIAVQARDDHDREQGEWLVVTGGGDFLAGYDTQEEAQAAADRMNKE